MLLSFKYFVICVAILFLMHWLAQMVKIPSAIEETWIQSLDWEDPLEEGMAAHSSILAWRIPWRSLAGYSPWDRKESATTEQQSTWTWTGYFPSTYFVGKELILLVVLLVFNHPKFVVYVRVHFVCCIVSVLTSAQSRSRVWLFAAAWTVTHQPLPMEFSMQEHWGGLPFPPPGALPHLGIETL